MNKIHHWVSKKHIQKYADMFVFRWNTKHYNEKDRMLTISYNACKISKITYRDLVCQI